MNGLVITMHNERQVSLFRNGRDQLIIELTQKKSLKELLPVLSTLNEDFSEIADPVVEPDNIF
ncbi:MAG: hypothetical protein HRU77_00535 [Gammaproteobacteria bacterium]|jgi:antitoxin VapB|nr:MAG: hypothetical protein HRU77_00535 [Gammaproteobacteria bacterium]